MPTPIYFCKIKHAWPEFTNEFQVRNWLTRYEGKEMGLQFIPYKNIRSLRQNDFYWFYLGIIADDTGDDAESLHEYFKRKHLPPQFLKVRNQQIKIPASTTRLTKSEMGEYLDKICSEVSIPIPDPKLIVK